MDEPQGNQIRWRINHSRTERGGWKYETTVELVGVMNDVIAFERDIEHCLRRIDDLARAEARTRNDLDGFDKAA